MSCPVLELVVVPCSIPYISIIKPQPNKGSHVSIQRIVKTKCLDLTLHLCFVNLLLVATPSLRETKMHEKE